MFLKAEKLSLTWDKEKGFKHLLIDEGEISPIKYKMSPILTTEKVLDKESIIQKFTQETSNVMSFNKNLILQKLENYN